MTKKIKPKRDPQGKWLKGERGSPKTPKFSKENQPTPESRAKGGLKQKTFHAQRRSLLNAFYKSTLGKRLVIVGEDGKHKEVNATEYLGSIFWDLLMDRKSTMLPDKKATVILKLIETLAPKEEILEINDTRFDSLIFKGSNSVEETNAEKLLEESKKRTKALDEEIKKEEDKKYALDKKKGTPLSDKLEFKEEKLKRKRAPSKLPEVKI